MKLFTFFRLLLTNPGVEDQRSDIRETLLTLKAFGSKAFPCNPAGMIVNSVYSAVCDYTETLLVDLVDRPTIPQAHLYYFPTHFRTLRAPES